MLKKYLIFIILFINGFIAIAQSHDTTYRLRWEKSKLYLQWTRTDGTLEIEVTTHGKAQHYHCPAANGTWELRLDQKEEPTVKIYRKLNGRLELWALRVQAVPLLSDGLCVQLPSETISATRQKDVFTLTFDMQKSCNVSDSTLVKTRLYWSKDSWANPKIDILLQEQDLPFGNQIHLLGKYNLEKGAKNGFLFLQIIDEKGNILLTTETIAAES
jgi:hypothetical protein